MSDPLTLFKSNMDAADALAATHAHLTKTIGAAADFDDLLRARLMHTISALDKFIHDLIRHRMVEVFKGLRPATAKYLTETISLGAYKKLTDTSVGAFPPEKVLENIIYSKHKTLSFQDPDKIQEALSLIWDESHKWQKIAATMGGGSTENSLKVALKVAVARRNLIVHEADIDPSTSTKTAISASDVETAAVLVRSIGIAISHLVA